ncbi:uncharacterized protein F4822DRAFT_434356 [Hypoxylon trugodes]|uniref:uncharacterized protein n=1 Tax=Hypoxylon trugodes TaxID=326681 RepID=UPI00219E5D5C|nr:uncharacterized protein F4822DRAFT_434356 [Hypoxylon trugodes]KAI1383237.1 hypothetical protein F4822DRAFT_434356 [Hypoxylon trugodes]
MPKYSRPVSVFSSSDRGESHRSESPPPPYSEAPPSFQPRRSERTPLLQPIQDPEPRRVPDWRAEWVPPAARPRRTGRIREYVQASFRNPFRSRLAYRISESYRSSCRRIRRSRALYNIRESCRKAPHSRFAKRIHRCFPLQCFLVFILFFIIFVCVHQFNLSGAWTFTPPTISIAIIGAGPAGISAAQHLHVNAALRNIRLNITLFESNPLIGGQLALNDSKGRQVYPYDDPTQNPIAAEDITGPALLWGNPLCTKATEKTIGDNVAFSELPPQKISFFTGDHVVATTTRPYNKFSFFDWWGMLFKYGSPAWAAAGIFDDGADLKDRFVHSPLDFGVGQLLASMGVLESAQQFAHDTLGGRGVGGAFVDEVLSPQVQRTSMQRVSDISDFGMKMAAFQQDRANTFIGGELLERLDQVIAVLGITVRTGTKVSGVKRKKIDDDKSAWLVEYNADGLSESRNEPFDKVIIAAPNFEMYRGASAEVVEAASMLSYRPAHVTFFTLPSRLDTGIYGDVNQILFLEEQNGDRSLDGVREVSFVREVVRTSEKGDGAPEFLYRALSDVDVTERLRELDLGITWMYQARLENAYPYLFPFRQYPRFKLSTKGIWWTSAIHAAASSIDLSWLAGKVVAEEVIQEVEK